MEAGKWYQVGNPFAPLTETDGVKLNEVFITGFRDGDTLMILDSETSRYSQQYFWVSQSSAGNGAWCSLPLAGATPVEVTLRPGQAVSILKGESSAVTFSGKVEAVQVEFGEAELATWAQVAVVWPTSTKLNNLQWTGMKFGDVVQIMDPETSAYSAQMFWVPSTSSTSSGAWCNLPMVGATPVDIEIAPGQALFINKGGSGVGTVRAQ